MNELRKGVSARSVAGTVSIVLAYRGDVLDAMVTIFLGAVNAMALETKQVFPQASGADETRRVNKGDDKVMFLQSLAMSAMMKHSIHWYLDLSYHS